eukprot:comp11316_c0_seq1/m.5719 comp11316_c0_seq1/g.5719  ORF comp11316_c0_seq1/g.5719 comp11316_c0_seq1/m.5719 type:complete len:145 (-) comp11316_c0_seq1:570-1004(-)
MRFFSVLVSVLFSIACTFAQTSPVGLAPGTDLGIVTIANIFIYKPLGTTCPYRVLQRCSRCFPQGLSTKQNETLFNCVTQCITNPYDRDWLAVNGCPRLVCLRALQAVCGGCLYQRGAAAIARCGAACWAADQAGKNYMRAMGC